MFRKLLSVLAMSSILLVSSSLAFAKSQRDWSTVESLVNQEAAIKTQNGKTTFGIVKSVNADSLVLQAAGNKTLTQTETTINRNEVKKIWRALLYVNEGNAGKGALIGAGIGAAAYGLPSIARGRDENDIGASLVGATFIIGAIGGAAVGAIAGFFVKTKHKKRDLVYSQ